MKIIGLTGGIGSGKTTVARILRQKNIPVLCADDLARHVVRPGKTAYQKIVRIFGKGVLRKDKTINRVRLGSMVFAGPKKRRLLEKIIHPEVIRLTKKETRRLRKQGKKIVVWDVPLLFESGMNKFCDKVIVVYAPRSLQAKRIQKRDHFSSAEIKNRLASQIPIEKKKNRADFVIDNSGSIQKTSRQVKQLTKLLAKVLYVDFEGNK